MVIDTGRLSGPALRAFLNIAQRWGLTTSEQRTLLGDIPKSTYERMRNSENPVLNRDAIERISHVIGIYKALRILFPGARYADRWVREPNEYYGGETALSHMLSSFTGLAEVRRYLDSERGW